MARPFKLAITESEAELQSLMHQMSGIQKERVQMLWWVKSGQVDEHQEIVTRLGRNGSTITRWLQKYRAGGLAALLEVKQAPGQAPIMSEAVQASLQKALESPQGFRSYGEIVEWLQREHGLVMEYGTVYNWVHNRWGAKLKVARPRSEKQSASAVADFKETRRAGGRTARVFGIGQTTALFLPR
jgi:transposase